MPTNKSNNGWKTVLRNPSKKLRKNESCFIINTPGGDVFVQFLFIEIHPKIRRATNHFLNNHAAVRGDVIGETGKMTAAGLRVAYVSSSKTIYSNKQSSLNDCESMRLLKEASSAFHSCFKNGKLKLMIFPLNFYAVATKRSIC